METTGENTKVNNWAVPIAIVLAGIFIAGAVYLSQNAPADGGALGGGSNDVKNAVKVDETDWIRGNPDAQIVIVEYSDLECPFCKQFHATMQRLMDEYGKDGRIAWVYRHFPLASLHPNAPKHAEAAECAGKLGGVGAFWTFIDTMIAANPGNTLADVTRYGEWAEAAGVDGAAVNDCVASGETKSLVDAEYANAIASGGSGTPYNVLFVKGAKEPVAVSGALPYENIKGIIDSILAEQR
jgi:protein-disulfide isomerase